MPTFPTGKDHGFVDQRHKKLLVGRDFCCEIASAGNEPKIVTIDTPLGMGAEVAVNYTTGTTSFG